MVYILSICYSHRENKIMIECVTEFYGSIVSKVL